MPKKAYRHALAPSKDCIASNGNGFISSGDNYINSVFTYDILVLIKSYFSSMDSICSQIYLISNSHC